MMEFMYNKHHKLFDPKVMALSITTALLVTGCVTAEDSSSAPHSQTPDSISYPDANHSDNSTKAAQCGPFTPDKEQTMCTMQYDPVCVKHKAANGQVSYKTAGNACMACTTATAISYTPGECGTGLPSR